MIIFVVYGVFPTKILKGALYYCAKLDSTVDMTYINNKWDCLDYGGSWVN